MTADDCRPELRPRARDGSFIEVLDVIVTVLTSGDEERFRVASGSRGKVTKVIPTDRSGNPYLMVDLEGANGPREVSLWPSQVERAPERTRPDAGSLPPPSLARVTPQNAAVASWVDEHNADRTSVDLSTVTPRPLVAVETTDPDFNAQLNFLYPGQSHRNQVKNFRAQKQNSLMTAAQRATYESDLKSADEQDAENYKRISELQVVPKLSRQDRKELDRLHVARALHWANKTKFVIVERPAEIDAPPNAPVMPDRLSFEKATPGFLDALASFNDFVGSTTGDYYTNKRTRQTALNTQNLLTQAETDAEWKEMMRAYHQQPALYSKYTAGDESWRHDKAVALAGKEYNRLAANWATAARNRARVPEVVPPTTNHILVAWGFGPKTQPPTTPSLSPSSTAGPSSKAEQLRELFELKQVGALTEEEYAATKAQVIDGWNMPTVPIGTQILSS